MMNDRYSLLSLTIVILFGFILFFIGTDGFSAYTAETARVNRLIEEQPVFPHVTFEDSKGRVYPITEFRDKYVLVTFIYTSCATVCVDLERNMAQVYEQIPKQHFGEDLIFLSVTFDTKTDDPATLERYRVYFNSDGESWRMARIPDQHELNTLLSSFGVIVIPDGNGHFTHNAAFYLVDKQGTLIDVMDYTKIEQATAKIVGLLELGSEG